DQVIDAAGSLAPGEFDPSRGLASTQGLDRDPQLAGGFVPAAGDVAAIHAGLPELHAVGQGEGEVGAAAVEDVPGGAAADLAIGGQERGRVEEGDDAVATQLQGGAFAAQVDAPGGQVGLPAQAD